MIYYRSVSNPDALAAYVKLAGVAAMKAGGRLLVRGGTAAVMENGSMQRTVVVEFDSLAAARAAYESSDYQAALAALDGGADRDFRLCEGAAA